jgi:hypothetical protein
MLVFSGIIVALFLFGLVILFRKRFHAEAFLCLVTVSVFICWPYQDPRFLLPILPFFYLALLEAIDRLVSSFRRKSAPREAFLVLLVAECFYLVFPVRTALLNEPAAPPAAARWLVENAQPGEGVLTEETSVWLTGGLKILVKKSDAQLLDHPELWFEDLYHSEARWVLLENSPLLSLVGSLPQHFRLAYMDEDRRRFVFEIVGNRRAARTAGAWYRAAVRNMSRGLSGELQLKRSLTLEPWFPTARLILANYLFQQERYDEARVEVEVLLRQQPQNPAVINLAEKLGTL